jgi:hypothetical protein
VQLTWKGNYKRAALALGVDFVRHPDRVMEPANAATIMFQGMRDGWFTGKGFADYINDRDTDYINARRIINGMDKAKTISNYANKFESAINAQMQAPQEPKPVPVPTAPDEPKGLLARLLDAIMKVFCRPYAPAVGMIRSRRPSCRHFGSCRYRQSRSSSCRVLVARQKHQPTFFPARMVLTLFMVVCHRSPRVRTRPTVI